VKRLAILGSTGSIGRQTLDVVRSLPDEFDIVALAAGRNTTLLRQQVAEFRPRYCHCTAEATAEGVEHIEPREMACLPEVDLLVVATVGDAGMRPTLDALNAGKPVALANKEILIMAGGLITAAAEAAGGRILPIDSEPSAIWQCVKGDERAVKRLIITASGGAFRDRTWDELSGVTPEEALKHPTWSMGPKITIDSATLMNKAFEVIEAHWLFRTPYECIDAVVHHQSIIHSMVEFEDGTVKAQLGPPDMRYPIQHALTFPDGLANETLPDFDPVGAGSLTFEALDAGKHPCFGIGLEAGKRGDTWPSVLTGADEAAVGMFLDGRIRFTQIPDIIEATLAAHTPVKDPDLEAVMDASAWAAEYAAGSVRG